MGRYQAAAIFLAALLGILSSCGGKVPEIAAVEWRLESRPSARGGAFESLSVFASIKDEDGLGNIEELWIVNDQAAVAWKLTDADWIKAPEGGDDWLGSSSLAAPELKTLPRGAYRFVAVDAAGQRAEMDFEVSGAFPDKAAPVASYASQGEVLSIRSDWPETLALAFDATGALIASPSAPKQAATLTELFGGPVAVRTAWAGAYGYDPSLKMGAFSPRAKTR